MTEPYNTLSRPYYAAHLKRTFATTNGILVFIDPGHGGQDPGALGRHSRESDNVLKVAKRIKELLIHYGFTVMMARETDKWVTLESRSDLANRYRAVIFLSLHNNSAKASTATGFETFIYSGPVGSETVRLQNALHSAIAPQLPIIDRGKKRANFSVLRRTVAPACLIEYAFINNATDERLLVNEVELLAQTTVNGVLQFFGVSKKVEASTSKSKEVDEMAKQLTPTQQKDAKKLFAHAYRQGVFSADHSKTVDKMTVGQAAMLTMQYVARSTTK